MKQIFAFFLGMLVMAFPLTARSEVATLPTEPNSIAVGPGCSMTENALDGYRTLGGERVWDRRNPNYKMSGGVIQSWTTPTSSYWVGGTNNVGFAGKVSAHGTPEVVWMMLCSSKAGNGMTYANFESAYNVLRTYAPDATVYLSSQPRYVDGHRCAILGNTLSQQNVALTRINTIIEQAITNGLVEPGPTMPVLATEQTRDGCHANTDGQLLLGQAVYDFFEAEGEVEPTTVWVCRNNTVMSILETELAEGETAYSTETEAASDPNCTLVWVCRSNAATQVYSTNVGQDETAYSTEAEAASDPNCTTTWVCRDAAVHTVYVSQLMEGEVSYPTAEDAAVACEPDPDPCVDETLTPDPLRILQTGV